MRRSGRSVPCSGSTRPIFRVSRVERTRGPSRALGPERGAPDTVFSLSSGLTVAVIAVALLSPFLREGLQAVVTFRPPVRAFPVPGCDVRGLAALIAPLPISALCAVMMLGLCQDNAFQRRSTLEACNILGVVFGTIALTLPDPCNGLSALEWFGLLVFSGINGGAALSWIAVAILALANLALPAWVAARFSEFFAAPPKLPCAAFFGAVAANLTKGGWDRQAIACIVAMLCVFAVLAPIERFSWKRLPAFPRGGVDGAEGARSG